LLVRATLLACCLGLSLPALFSSLACLPVATLIALVCVFLSLRYAAISKSLLYACLFAFCLGLGWHWLWATLRLANVIEPQLEGIDVLVAGRVVSLPVATEIGQRFIFEVVESDTWRPDELPVRLQLSTFGPGEGEAFMVRSGEYWQWFVRLKRPHGYANPGGRDSEAFLLRNNIAATGYVRNSERNIRLDDHVASQSFSGIVGSLRSTLWWYLDELLAGYSQRELMLALMMGEQSRITPQRWQLFSDTGTNHLFVISGLHIGLVAMVSFTLGWRLLALLSGPTLPWPAQQLAAIAAMAASSAYALMAGFTLPTQRALVMVLVFLSAYLSRRRLSLSLRYCLALTVVLLLDPLATTSAGFWLSFMAVGVLILFADSPLSLRQEMSATERLISILKQSWRAQWVVFAGLLLPMLFWMGQVSLIAPLVNLVAIPLVGGLLVPLLLLALMLGAIADGMGNAILALCDWLLLKLLYLLNFAAGLGDSLQFEPALPGISAYLFLLLAIGLLLLPRATPGRYLAVPLCLPLLLPTMDKPGEGELWVDVLDVGQGLSVLLRTREHSLLYDTGAGSPAGWSAADSIVIPALRRLGVGRLDSLLVSHGDNDHAGGMEVILKAYPQASLLANTGGSRCRAGQRWRWNGVSFEILHPQQTGATSNDDSCVLRIEAGNQAVLLPGDIEAAVEWDLALQFGVRLQSTLLIAPHHGSASSSSYPFIKSVNPEQVVFSAGYRNGFSHPATQIEARYREWGIASYNTAECGMLSFRLTDVPGEEVSLGEPGRYRHKHRKYWSWSGNPWSCRYQ
jgi:competence protein ComEC